MMLSLDLSISFSIPFQHVFINRREPSLCCLIPVLTYRKNWNAWFSLDLDFISTSAKASFSWQKLHRWEKCLFFSFLSSFATLVVYTENYFLLLFKSLSPLYLFHLISQFLVLWGSLIITFLPGARSDSYHFVVMCELWFHNCIMSPGNIRQLLI